MVAEPGLEVLDEAHGAGGYRAVIDMHSDDYKLLDLREEFVKDCLVHFRLFVAQRNEYFAKFLIPTTCGLLESINRLK